ncbi:MAG: 50S ribosomal protein L24e [Methanomassiliicoccales archaeon]
MVERRICSFCGHEIEPGTGRMFVKKDGTIYMFCTSKCYKNMVFLKRVPRRTEWTHVAQREKQTVKKASEPTVDKEEGEQKEGMGEEASVPLNTAEMVEQGNEMPSAEKIERKAKKIRKSAENPEMKNGS